MYSSHEGLGALPSDPTTRRGILAALTVDDVLYGLRQHESGGNYTAKSRISTASGAYQYINGTWNRFRGYLEARQAPPAVQDERARMDLVARFNQFRDWEKTVAGHFYPAWANDPSKWNRSPAPGNPTVRAYVDSVLDKAQRAMAARGVGVRTGPVVAVGKAPKPAPSQANIMGGAMAAGLATALWSRAKATQAKIKRR
jgi:hypothetical protein